MKKRKALRAIAEVGRRKGISTEKVLSDIQYAIDVTRKRVYEENDLAAIAAWESIPCSGDAPTPIELLIYLSEKVNADMGK